MTEPTPLPQGIVVIGTHQSGLGRTASFIGGLTGATVISAEPDLGGGSFLADVNERLLQSAGGSWTSPPKMAFLELARVLTPERDRSRTAFERTWERARSKAPGATSPTWVWADSRLTFLLPFWVETLAVPPLVVWVVRNPNDVVSELVEAGMAAETAAVLWECSNRAALAGSQSLEVLLVRDELVASGTADEVAEGVRRLAAFFDEHGVECRPEAIGRSTAKRSTSGGEGGVPAGPGDRSAAVPDGSGWTMRQAGVLYNLLLQLEGTALRDTKAVAEATAAFYDEDYYQEYASDSDVPYGREEPSWVAFFGAVAAEIVRTLQPKTAMDAGCAVGMLVEALRDRGVDASGIDVSSWAIKQIPDDVRPYCSVGSITEPFPDRYDLITCIEVLEHLPPALAGTAVANLCAHADTVLLSSSPDDVMEPTHLNVEPPDYWARLFAQQGFTRDLSYDAGFVSPHTVLFRKGGTALPEVVAAYERRLRSAEQAVEEEREERRLVAEDLTAAHGRMEEARDLAVVQRDAAIAEHDALAERYNDLVVDRRELEERAEQLEKRRIAEGLAANQWVFEVEHSHTRLLGDLVALQGRTATAEAELAAMRATKLFRYSGRLRRAYSRFRRQDQGGAEPAAAPEPSGDQSYGDWVERYDTLDEAERSRLRRELQRLPDQPLFSVVMPVYNTPEALLHRAIQSVQEQVYGNWELCLADDLSTDPVVASVLDHYASADARIKVVRRTENGHISAASNSAIAVAEGSWLVMMDHDDELAPHALAHAALALATHPDVGIVYTDEDKMETTGRRHSPNFKPDFDPLLLLGQNYLGHLVLYRRDLVQAVGGYRVGLEGSQDWDLTLRVSELLEPAQVLHLPRVLYHWRSHPASTAGALSAKPYATVAGRRAVVEHLNREQLVGDVITNPVTGWHRVKWRLPADAPKVSILIPTRDGRLLARCLESVFRLTAYPNFDVVVIDNGSISRAMLEYLRGQEHLVRVVRDERPFNYSALNNLAAERADGDLLCLLNDDCEVTSSEWLDELVGQTLQAGVGVAGAKLLYPDGRIQHAGVILGMDGVAGHVHRLSDRLAPGHGGRLHLPQTYSAVTAACMVVRREAWEQVGGFDEVNLAVAFNDVDLCLRIREAGWRIVWSPFAEMIHHESLTRGDESGEKAERFARECSYMKVRWGKALRCDPVYNPNLSLLSYGPELAFPPRSECS